MIPFLDVRLPEFWPFASGTKGLVPGAVTGDPEVARKEERQDDCELGREQEESRV